KALPAISVPAHPGLSRCRRFYRVRLKSPVARATASQHLAVPSARHAPCAGCGGAGVGAGRLVVGSLVVLEGRLSGDHDHRHRAVSESILPHAAGHAGQARLRPHGAGGAWADARRARGGELMSLEIWMNTRSPANARAGPTRRARSLVELSATGR